MSNFATSLENIRHHNSIVERMEFALRNDPNNPKLRLGLGSAKRRAMESQKALDSYSSKNHIDLIQYRIENSRNSYAAKAVADSVSCFQSSFTGIVDYLENGPKDRSNFSAQRIRETELEFAYTFAGSLGIVLSCQNDRDLISGKFDGAVDVLGDFLRVSDTNSALDASRHLGLALVSQLCDWVNVNAKWENNIDYVWKRSDGILRGEYISGDKFHQIKDIFDNAEEVETKIIEVFGILVGLDLESSFHFVVPNGEGYKGKLSSEFKKVPTTVGNSYSAKIAASEKRKIATGKSTITYSLLNLN